MGFDALKERYPRLIPAGLRFECGTGWEGILERYFAEVEAILPEDSDLGLKGVFEKYGTLNIDAWPRTASTDIVDRIEVRGYVAESRSARTCETCGRPGRKRDRPYIFVACDAHAEGAPSFPEDYGTYGGIYAYDPGIDDVIAVPGDER